jgi:hypothetical protein
LFKNEKPGVNKEKERTNGRIMPVALVSHFFFLSGKRLKNLLGCIMGIKNWLEGFKEDEFGNLTMLLRDQGMKERRRLEHNKTLH